MYNSYLARKTLIWFKYIVLLHTVGALFMFSNSSILPYAGKVKTDMTLEEQVTAYSDETSYNEELQAIRIILYGLTFVLVILIYLFWKYAVRLCIRVCGCCCQTDVADKLIRS